MKFNLGLGLIARSLVVGAVAILLMGRVEPLVLTARAEDPMPAEQLEESDSAAVEPAADSDKPSEDQQSSATEEQETPPKVEKESDDKGTEDKTAEESAEPPPAKDEEVEEGGGEEEQPAEEPEKQKTPAEDPSEEKQPPAKKKRIIGATAEILEKQSGILFRARVDTGAKSCSLHVEEMEIVDEVEGWKENIGKVVRFKVTNGGKKTDWLDRRIHSYVVIKHAGSRTRRYKVPMTLRWKGVEKKVLVTLTNRNGMAFPLLLGRNFLKGDFLVDVDMDNDD